ncbi:uncharacterized protein LOC123443066 isoform X2 [Hordeum vulgare subsp. vulgare]|uniref:uncharacterized protein LOC123443066 isoform X2 n=1 Tax=Hordeum vulgare subsp. vulgare TaxID=112509 RepID=UPI001D1A3EFF|nr:uncharacterized protein LOC123443066 isoform X2 [Hordeum vulgare subsp. vulgare]
MRRSKQISPAPTHLSIYSPQAVNLTLIGLPGRTKVAIEWQLENIAQDKENVVRLYVEKTNCIILATSPANQDIATSDAIKLARDADSTGERSFGMLTKLDFMDKGTNALDVHYVLKELVRKCKCKYLVEQIKEVINAPGYGAVALGSTPFMVSAQSGVGATVKYFHDHAGDDKGRTDLHHAVAAGNRVPPFKWSAGRHKLDAHGTPAYVAVVNEQDKTLKILLDQPTKAFSKCPSPKTRSAIKNASIFTYVVLMLIIFSSFISSVSAEVATPKCPAPTINGILPRYTCPVIQLTSDHWLHSKRESKFLVGGDHEEHEQVPEHYEVDDSRQEFDSLGYIFLKESTLCDWFFRLVVWKLRQNQRVKFLLGDRSLILVWIDTLILSMFYHICWILYGHLLSKSKSGDEKHGKHIYHNNVICCILFLPMLILLLRRHRTAQAARYLCIRLLGLSSLGLLFYCSRGVQSEEDNISTVGAIGFGAMILMYIIKSFTVVEVKYITILLNIPTLFGCLRCEHHHLQSWYGWAFLGTLLYKIMEIAAFVYMLYRERAAGAELR